MKEKNKYFEIDAINWSTLKEMARSPLHYQYRLNNPREDSVAFIKGRAVHTAVLESEKFVEEYAVFEGKIRSGKKWDAFVAANEGKSILKVDEYDSVYYAAKAVREHPEAAKLLKKGTPERSFLWEDEDTKLKCKCRVDWVGEALFDLKTTSDVDSRKFGNLAARMMYHAQLAMYKEGSKHKGEVFIVAVEIDPPFDVAVFQLDDDTLFAGQELYKGLLKQVAECRKSNKWPGKYTNCEILSLPKYVFEDENQEDGSFKVVGE